MYFIFPYSLLYTLAFKPSYLQQLLAHIRAEKQISLFGSSDTSLIQLLAKGVHLAPSETQRIVPVLDVFCSLFSHLLVTLDNSEFYHDSSELVIVLFYELFVIHLLILSCSSWGNAVHPFINGRTGFHFARRMSWPGGACLSRYST